MERVFILMFGLTCTICGVVWGLKRWRLRRNGARTMGTIVGFSRSGVVRPYLTPIVEFKTDAGNTIRFRGSTGQRSPPYQQDQRVNVIYSRQDPWNAQIDNFEQFWLGPVSIGFFGLIIIGTLIFGKLRTREDDSSSYWAMGLMVFFGALLTVLAASEYRSYRISRDSHKGENSGSDLLARIDHACRLYPEGRETLLRVKTAVVNLNDGTVNSALNLFLDKALRAHDREEALKEIQNLAKALDMIGKS